MAVRKSFSQSSSPDRADPLTADRERFAAAVDELTRDRSALSLEAANREVYLFLKEGIKMSVAERNSTRDRLIRPAATFSPARRRQADRRHCASG